MPLVLWLSYHHYKTGYFLGNPEYLRYNLGATLTPLRVALAMLIRLWHLLGYLNLFVLTLMTLYAMSLPALLERDGSERPRIAIPVQIGVRRGHCWRTWWRSRCWAERCWRGTCCRSCRW